LLFNELLYSLNKKSILNVHAKLVIHEKKFKVDDFGPVTNPNRRTPGTHSVRYKEMGIAFQEVASADFINGFGDVVEGPHLTIVGVTTELKVNAGFHGFFEMKGLVIDQNDGKGVICILQNFGNFFSFFPAKPRTVAVFTAGNQDTPGDKCGGIS
jgi:hypothetical protein